MRNRLLCSAAQPTTLTDLPAEPDVTKLPSRVTRQTAAMLITRYFFPTSHRSLESWPVAVVYVNGKALAPPADWFAEARRRLESAPKVMGGRPPRRGASTEQHAA
jgi:hypothetical protein